MNDNLGRKTQNTAEFSFVGNPRRVITRERDGQYLRSGVLELGNYSLVSERAFDESGRPLEWRFFEDGEVRSVLEYRYEGDECVVTERDSHGEVVEVTRQKAFSIAVEGSERRVPLPDSWTILGVVAKLKYEFDFDSTGNWIKCTTTATVDSATTVHVQEREIMYW